MELIRYIHLNPLRAGLVKDLKELDKYPWTGHSAILGKRKNPLVPCPSPKNRFTQLNCSEGAPKGIQLGPEKPEKYLAEKTIEDVLLQFGDKLREARRRYRQKRLEAESSKVKGESEKLKAQRDNKNDICL